MIVKDGTRASESGRSYATTFRQGYSLARVGRRKRSHSGDDRSLAGRGCAICRIDPHRADGGSFAGRRRSLAIEAGPDEPHDQRHRGHERWERDQGAHDKVAAGGKRLG